MLPAFTAKFSGVCADCGGHIRVGEQIRRWFDPLNGDSGYAHADCDEEPDAILLGRQCPKCHLTMPLSGVCDCED